MKRRGFTLIELLVVIAIIAILAAIAFPVMARAKDNAFRNADISNMNSLRAALQLYRVDQGAYPPAILGYATLYASGPNAGQVIPANQLRTFLYPRRVDAIDTFRPSPNRVALNLITTAVWPQADERPDNTAPILDLNGDGIVSNIDDDACSRQAYGYDPTGAPDGVTRRNPNGPGTIPAEFYKVSGYDVAQVRTPTGLINELRYTLFWTRWGLASDNTCSPSGSPGNGADDPRQLGYSDPPDNTMVTWNSFYRDYTNGVPDRTKRDIALFIGGAARPFDSRGIAERSWRVTP